MLSAPQKTLRRVFLPFRVWGIPRPGAGYFALSGKVTKPLLKPLRFQPSRFYEGPQ